MKKMRISTKRNYKKRTKQILEPKDTITELKNSLEGFNIRVGQAEERISDFKTVHLKLLIQRNEEEKKKKKSEKSLRDLWTNIYYKRRER